MRVVGDHDDDHGEAQIESDRSQLFTVIVTRIAIVRIIVTVVVVGSAPIVPIV